MLVGDVLEGLAVVLGDDELACLLVWLSEMAGRMTEE